jgi:hypothetical protein
VSAQQPDRVRDVTDKHSNMPPCAGLRAHVDLSRISGYIVCQTFKVAPRNYKPGYSVHNIDKALRMLEDWKLQLPSILAIEENTDPACCTLHMAQNQLIVLTTRPIMLAAVKQAVAERYMNGQWSPQQHARSSHIQTCSDAAHRNLVLAQRLGPTRKLLQAGLHFVFNAAVILLLNQILSSSNSHKAPTPPNTDIYASAIQFALRIFEEASRTGTNYPRDCRRVLQDLSALVDRYLSHGHGTFEQRHDLYDATHVVGQHNATHQDPETRRTLSNMNEGDELHQEMMTWIQSNGLQLHNSLLI